TETSLIDVRTNLRMVRLPGSIDHSFGRSVYLMVTSHSLTPPSAAPLTSVLPSGENTTGSAGAGLPCMTASSLPTRTSQSFTSPGDCTIHLRVLSWLPPATASTLPFLEKDSDTTGRECFSTARSVREATSHSRTVPW